MPRKSKEASDKALYKPATVAQNARRREVIGSSLGLNSRHD